MGIRMLLFTKVSLVFLGRGLVIFLSAARGVRLSRSEDCDARGRLARS